MKTLDEWEICWKDKTLLEGNTLRTTLNLEVEEVPKTSLVYEGEEGGTVHQYLRTESEEINLPRKTLKLKIPLLRFFTPVHF